MADKGASFPINIEGNAAQAAGEISSEVKSLRDQINSSTNSVRDMNAQIRNLKGTSDEVVKKKEELRAKVKLENEAISIATAALVTHNATLKESAAELELAKKKTEELAKVEEQKANALKEQAAVEAAALKKKNDELKAASIASEKHNQAIKNLGGPIQVANQKLETFKTVIGSGRGLMIGFSIAAAAAAAAFIGIGAAISATIGKIVNFSIVTADAARSAGLLRTASMNGNEQWGKNFGEQVEALARKVPTSIEEIDKLGLALGRNRIGGKLWVDTLNAVTQASSALGDQAGSKIEEFITRGKRLGNFHLDPLEMIGSGIDFKEVVTELAQQVGTTPDKARMALYQGRVKIGDGAQALRTVIERKFGGINLAQNMSLDNLGKKFRKLGNDLIKDVNITPLLESFDKLLNMFSLSEQSGQALKTLIGIFSNEFIGGVKDSTPIVEDLFLDLIISAQDLAITYFKVKKSLDEAFGDGPQKKFSVMKTLAEVVAAQFRIVADSVNFVAAAFADFPNAMKDIFGSDSKKMGEDLGDGLIKGIESKNDPAKKAIASLGTAIQESFADKMKIASPSKVFEEYGKNTAEGFQIGVEGKSASSKKAVEEIGNSAPLSGQSGQSRSMSPVQINITIEGGTAAASDKSVLNEMIRALNMALQSAGLPEAT
jgi:hypothetical protein